ncbi:hypothetical protein [Streptomyces anulatus]|uniref:hypothetical protein n=1 Tax=Streptomyces anulatus TaxID=1892 RepID=UPI00386353DA|nr:hypothetical protein [Streptomyces sp. HB372]
MKLSTTLSTRRPKVRLSPRVLSPTPPALNGGIAEHHIERAYRDRFTRTDRPEEALRRHSDFLTTTITAHAAKPSACLVAVACPTRHPHGAPSLNRDEARYLLHVAEERGNKLPTRRAPGPMTGMSDALINPRPGPRR